jgi:hypothetical protein
MICTHNTAQQNVQGNLSWGATQPNVRHLFLHHRIGSGSLRRQTRPNIGAQVAADPHGKMSHHHTATNKTVRPPCQNDDRVAEIDTTAMRIRQMAFIKHLQQEVADFTVRLANQDHMGRRTPIN